VFICFFQTIQKFNALLEDGEVEMEKQKKITKEIKDCKAKIQETELQNQEVVTKEQVFAEVASLLFITYALFSTIASLFRLLKKRHQNWDKHTLNESKLPPRL
jgi:hypothetical protein